MSFRTDCQLHFLTYPQCEVPKEECLRQLKEKYGSKYGWCVVSKEDHEERENDSNVGVHLHVMAYCKTRFTTRDPRFWDLKYQDKVFHPHFEAAKKKAQCLEYVIKDGDYIEDGIYNDAPFSVAIYLQANKGKQGYGFTYLAKALTDGKSIFQLMDEVPGMVMNHKRKIEDYQKLLVEKKKQAVVKPPFYGFERVEDFYWTQVVNWANLNFIGRRVPRQKQLWLWSRQPELGKSYPWAITMRKFKTCYEWIYGPKQAQEIFGCEYILIDELKGGITVTELKSLSQMYGMNLDIKYGHPQFFDKNVPLIITSNRPPREIYHKCNNEDMESLESRFEIIEVNTHCQLVPKESEELSSETTNLLLGTPDFVLSPVPTQVLLNTDPLLEKEDMSEEDRNEDDHSEFSNDEFEEMQALSKKDWLKKHGKNLNKN